MESALKQIKAWDSAGLALIRRAANELLQTNAMLKEKYEHAVDLLERDGMKAIWRQWHQNRRLVEQLEDDDPMFEDAEIECMVLRSLTKNLKKKSSVKTGKPAGEAKKEGEEKPKEETKEAVKTEIPKEKEEVVQQQQQQQQQEKKAEPPKEEVEKPKEEKITKETEKEEEEL